MMKSRLKSKTVDAKNDRHMPGSTRSSQLPCAKSLKHINLCCVPPRRLLNSMAKTFEAMRSASSPSSYLLAIAIEYLALLLRQSFERIFEEDQADVTKTAYPELLETQNQDINFLGLVQHHTP